MLPAPRGTPPRLPINSIRRSCMRSRIIVLPAVIMIIAIAGCADPTAAPHPDVTAPEAAATRSVVRTHTEFDGHVDATFYLSCVDQDTHWVGDFHAQID